MKWPVAFYLEEKTQFLKEIVSTLKLNNLKCDDLIAYLERHIEVDSGCHSVLSANLIKDLCKDDEKKWKEDEVIAQLSIQ